MLVFVRLFKVEGDIYYNYLHIPCCNYSGSIIILLPIYCNTL